MKIRVRAFASLADICGPEVSLELREGATMNDAIESLSERFPTLEARLEGTRFAKNMTFCERSTPLSENDELALIPPVSGG